MKGVLAWIAVIGASAPALAADDPADHRTLAETCSTRTDSFTDDVKCYVTSPVRWDGRDWLYFGGSVAAVALAHHYDEDVRTHFVGTGTSPGTSDSHDTEDALPAAGVVAATWLYATITRDHDGQSETWQMLEAAGFSSATSYLLKYAAGRERPDATSDPDQWRTGGDSFPSLHTTAAFAIGTVLAESGSDRYRWVRRFLGYGMAGYTG
ncbi:MAG TPA: phosphatase PAP2 family protein, partial [Povalibacter sp.]|nr:phosphatase PAP2 family protein [Povalibacter sp.]